LSTLLESLQREPSIVAAELRPPRAELQTAESMDAWIDTYHAVRGLTRNRTFVFLTDSAVGLKEEDNLRHLVNNLGSAVPRSRVVPFLTTKHSIEYCLAYADRAYEHGFGSLVVLGGDKNVGPARCVEHAWQLREAIHRHRPGLTLGGWANPHGNAADQVGHLLSEHANADFYLTQIVSHHSAGQVGQFVEEGRRRGLTLPGLYGVFYYRSANPKTLNALRDFLPVPVEGLTREFGEGATAEEICARSLRALSEAGAQHFYISNLPLGRASQTMERILNLLGSGSS
jgi:5,10-methylenetetrahydrofolate reductase